MTGPETTRVPSSSTEAQRSVDSGSAIPKPEPEQPQQQPPLSGVSEVTTQVADVIEGTWPQAIRYEPRRPVSWFAPGEILRGGYDAYLASLFSSFADSRERQAALRPATIHHRLAPSAGVSDFVNDPLVWHQGASLGRVDGDRLATDPTDLTDLTGEAGEAPHDRLSDDPVVVYDELWFDYVADLGDGFDATYTIAQQIAEPIEGLPGEPGAEPVDLPAVDLLVMGGDEVYPAASPENYRDRTIGPYRTALGPNRVPRIPLFAVPGNHDWYDGLSSFLTNFTVLEPGTDRPLERGWSKHQTRSYFAVQLTDRWWLWGIDIALDAHIDAPQMAYFRRVASIIPNGSRIVLCTAKPSWLKRPGGEGWAGRLGPLSAPFGPRGGDDGWDRLTYFVSRTVAAEPAERDLRVRLVLSGDKHFYARHESEAAEAPTLVVSGGGGAYLSSTREAADTLTLQSGFGREDIVEYRVRSLWPGHGRSAMLGFTAMWRFPLRNPGLALAFGFIYSLLSWAALAAQGVSGRSEAMAALADGGFGADAVLGSAAASASRLPGLAFWAALLGAMVALAGAHGGSRLKVGVAAVAHTALHAVGVGVVATAAAAVAVNRPGWDTWEFLGVSLLLGSVVGLFCFTFYLLVAQIWRLNLNELFAGIADEGYKQFVRFHVTDDALEAHVVGFESVPRWTLTWHDGRPRAKASGRPTPTLVDRFTVAADPPVQPATEGGARSAIR